jgi:hypothetical protein
MSSSCSRSRRDDVAVMKTPGTLPQLIAVVPSNDMDTTGSNVPQPQPDTPETPQSWQSERTRPRRSEEQRRRRRPEKRPDLVP